MQAQNIKHSLQIGLIGMGDMGRLYANCFLAAGYQNINICDIPSRYQQLLLEFNCNSNINVMKDGHAVSRISDFIIYSVEAAYISQCVQAYGPSTKVGAIVCGQTSVKQPEIDAFEEYLPNDVKIISCHSLHGPKVHPKSQPLVVIRYRATDSDYNLALTLFSALESNIVPLSYKEHDQITADTQAVTHLAFLSMGTAWKTRSTFPWENQRYLGGIDNVKILMALRIYGNKWHVYAGLAILNPSAKIQTQQYAKSVSDLFMMMIQEQKQDFKTRILKARDFVFGEYDERKPILLSDSLLEQFSLSIIPKPLCKPNSHLSLLAMVDCWYKLGIQPYKHLICQTPPFRLLLGITEYLFSDNELLEKTIETAVSSKEIRADDCEFYLAAKGWADVIGYGNMDGYKQRFEDTAGFFQDRIPEAAKISACLVQSMTEKLQ